ncbi:hypothetical protein SLEP1_g43678 [Rubroshorea leprosula]|uniref:Uncharacterized protein n=1 Tax=Rubroshorea leprosula TaxID=152421 RepID=A0AAV5LER1_9ROSI|nr:hypothetical protein SLEP1_g43678 [Rubroshorea leprosula]
MLGSGGRVSFGAGSGDSGIVGMLVSGGRVIFGAGYGDSRNVREQGISGIPGSSFRAIIMLYRSDSHIVTLGTVGKLGRGGRALGLGRGGNEGSGRVGIDGKGRNEGNGRVGIWQRRQLCCFRHCGQWRQRRVARLTLMLENDKASRSYDKGIERGHCICSFESRTSLIVCLKK